MRQDIVSELIVRDTLFCSVFVIMCKGRWALHGKAHKATQVPGIVCEKKKQERQTKLQFLHATRSDYVDAVRRKTGIERQNRDPRPYALREKDAQIRPYASEEEVG